MSLPYSVDRDRLFWKSTLFNEHDIVRSSEQYFDDYFKNSPQYLNFKSQLDSLFSDFRGQERSLEDWSEKETITNWIRDVLSALGWLGIGEVNKRFVREELSASVDEGDKRKKTYRVDIAALSSPNQKIYESVKQSLSNARKHVVMPIEAKFWGRIDLEDSSKQDKLKEIEKRQDNEHKDDHARSLGLSNQIQRYIEVFDCEYGILTDGKVWRLYHHDLSKSENACFEFRLGTVFNESRDFDILSASSPLEPFLKVFYLLFSRESHVSLFGRETPISYLLELKKQFADDVETDIKKRFIGAMNLLCNAFFLNPKNDQTSEVLRPVAESHLFNLFFIKTLEEKGRLPFASPKFKGHSITEVVKKLRYYDPELENAANPNESPNWQPSVDGQSSTMFDDLKLNPEGTEIYDRLLNLYEVLQHGGDSENFGLRIFGFKETVFSEEENELSKKIRISNRVMVRVLYQLFYTKPEASESHLMIPFKLFSSRQLGSIYESFLEFRLRKADDTAVIFKDKKWMKAEFPESEIAKFVSESQIGISYVQKGALYFDPDGNDRRLTGSYYTDDRVVEFIVNMTLDSLIADLSSDQILNLKICDPAMGSGHFLAEVARHISLAYREALKEKFDAESVGDFTYDESAALRHILENCIRGTDINPSAVKLAKMSLWLLVAKHGSELPNLENSVKFGDGLNLKSSFSEKIDAYVGNPPYVNAALMTKDPTDTYRESLRKTFESAKGAFDICSLFLESCDKHSPESRIGFILPNKIISSNGAKGMRGYLYKHKKLFVERVDDISRANVFPEASVYPVILIFGNQKPKSVLVRKHESDFELNQKYKKKKRGEGDYLPALISDVKIVQSGFRSLGDNSTMVGAATVAEAYEIKPAISEQKKANGRKFIVSGNLLPFAITWGFEKTRYLKKSYEAPYLDVTHPNVPATRKKQYSKKKIVIPNMTRRLRAYVDKSGTATGKSTTLILKSTLPLEALAAYINSDFATSQFKAKFESLHLNGDALRIGPPELTELPIPEILFKSSKYRNSLSSLYRKLEVAMKAAIKNHDKNAAKLRKLFDDGKYVSEFKVINGLFKKLNETVNEMVQKSKGGSKSKRKAA